MGSLCSPRELQEPSPAPQFKSISSLALSFLQSPTLTSIMTTGKTITLTRWTFVGKVMSLLFNMLSRLVVTFLPRNKHLLIYLLIVVSYDPFYFCVVCCDFSIFISNFVDLILLSFFPDEPG